MRPVEQSDIPDQAHHLALCSYLDHSRELGLCFLEVQELDLDELMRMKRLLRGQDQFSGQPVLSDLDHRLQSVRQTPQICPLRTLELLHPLPTLIPA